MFLCQTATNPDPTGLAPTCPQLGYRHRRACQAANADRASGPGHRGSLEFTEVLAALRRWVAYANVHSTKFLAEIRAQLRDDD